MDSQPPYFELLKNQIDLGGVPFTERGSRLLVFRENNHLAFRLSERWVARERQLSAYRRRPPIIDHWVFTDGAGEALELAITSYPHCLEVETRIGQFALIFADQESILVRLPPGPCGISFQANLDKAQPDRRGGVLRLTGDIRRNVAYTTNGVIRENTIEPLGLAAQQVRLSLSSEFGAELLLNITPRLGFNRYIPDGARVLAEAARRWQDWFAAAPPVLEQFQAQYYFAWWVMRAGLISTRYFTTREAMTPSKQYYVGVWLWDAYFHALAYRHVDRHLAQDQLRILLDHQGENGLLPDAIHDEGIVTHLNFPVDADVTKPPLLAWAAWKLYEQDGDREFLNEIYEAVVRWNRYWFEQNDRDGNGLCEYGHPFSSGLDDSPLWDAGMPVESPDLNTYLCLQMDALAKIAGVLGEAGDAAEWDRKADELARRMIEHMWDEQAGLFWASHNGERIKVRTPVSLYPLITGRMPAHINGRLVAHLTDPAQFWPPYPIPSVALDDPSYDPNQMWRGPTWVNINYLFVEGLQKAGYPQVADELRRRTLELVAGQADIFEYYHPQTGMNPPKAAAIFGWSSAVFIDLAIQASRPVHA